MSRKLIETPSRHLVKHTPMQPPFPEHLQMPIFDKDCFWSVEQSFWELDDVYTTATGYAGGRLESPSYSEICSTQTAHT